MTTVSTTQVLVDDSDPNIQYSTGWVEKLSPLFQSDPQYPMYGTLHETVNQTEIRYSFSGSSITACAQVTGTTVLPGVALDSDLALWSCSVDDVQVVATVINDINGPSTCCILAVGLDGRAQHEIRILASGSQDRPIRFDYLTYEASSAMPVADLFLSADDPTLKYTDGWEKYTINPGSSHPINAMVTRKNMASLIVDFYGSSILWFTFYNTTTGHDANYTFTVDDDGPKPMSLDQQLLNGSNFIQSIAFRTFALPRGQHRLEVIYHGDVAGNGFPLTLTSLVVQNGTISPSTSVTPSPPTSPTPSPSSLTTKGIQRAHLEIILGCCSAAVLALLILGIFCARRRIKRWNGTSTESGTSSLVEPFSHDPAAASDDTHQKGRHPNGGQEQPIGETAGVEPPPSYITGPHDS
ncbi:hypothetical protein GALMADRAFT_145373 [Galerina marginata CBS 339.88]|uniref:Transmembrane protein n=1 Tax=Galerina marginata (strain CBS 339.88) TaxID=685588 RepID=A0A067SFG1_GALM3|nr:hypothetical protein GALMADRAFT_145373 [Galerina marginata CBS 339.88]